MNLQPFKLERYFAEYEFKVKYLFSPSDCEALPMDELLAMASPQGLALWNGLKLGYTESQGHPLLREEISRQYQSIQPEEVLVAAPEEAIFLAMQALLVPGDHVVAIAPAYQSLHEIARAIGCSLTPLWLHPAEGGWRLDPGELERSLTTRTRLLVLNFPHNPTGHTLPLAELEQVLGMARQGGVAVFSDEMYRLLEYDPGERLPAACDLYEGCLSLSGLSKAHALPGLRIGWLAGRDRKWMERCLEIRDYTTICSSAPSEVLGIIALQAGRRILERNLGILRRNLALAGEFFPAHPDRFAWLPPRAGSVAFPRYLGPGSVEEFCAGVLERRGVMIVPGSLFDFPGDHFRIGLGRNNFGEALEQVEKDLETN